MNKGYLISLSKRKIIFLLFFLLATILLYISTKLFFYDEDIFVVNPQSNFLLDLTRASIVKLTFLIDNFFYKTNPSGYHVTNILLHLINTVLGAYTFKIFLSFTDIEKPKIKTACYFFLFVFLLSPIHSEPLCYLLGRAGLIVTFFCMLSFLFFLKANFKSPGLLTFSLLFFFAALFSYEISWTFPLIILCVSVYLKNYLRLQTRRIVIYVIPYFIVFIIWFLVKIIWFDHLKITPYGNNIFFTPSQLQIFKNVLVLFLRNIIPPFVNTKAFIVLSLSVSVLLFYGLSKLKTKNKQMFSFCLFILISCLFAYLPAISFGISSHNSESERYIYFSSVFAVMFLAIIFSEMFKLRTYSIATLFVCSFYAYLLFITINNYVQAGDFAKKYLEILAKVDNNSKYVYLISQPSQCNGALLFRANSNRSDITHSGITTLEDFMKDLYNKNNTTYITLSRIEVAKGDIIENIVHTSVDSLPQIFAGHNFKTDKNILINLSLKDTIFLKNEKPLIVGLKQSSLYIFN